MRKRIMAMLLVVLMILTSLPSEMVFATTTESKFTYELSGSDATITGYTDKTVTSLVIPETVDGYNVVAIAESAFSWDKYPNLTDLTVRGASVNIGNNMCGFDSDNSRNDNLILWGTEGSTINTYAEANLFTFKVVTSSITDIASESDVSTCYTNGGSFKIFTYLTVDSDEAAEDIIWESEDSEQATVTAFGTPTKQDDGTYKAEATVKVLTKGDGTCKLYASTRGLADKKEIELTIKQSATSLAVDAAIYTTAEDGYELLDTPDTFYQNNLITADEGNYLWISASVVGSDEDGVQGWTAGSSNKYMSYIGVYNDGWLFSLDETTADGYTYITVTSTSLVCSKTLNVKVTLPATGITMKYNEDTIIEDGGNILLIEGEQGTLEGTLSPTYSTDSVTWSSSNSNVATVAEDGSLTAHSSGNTVITCKVKDCDASARTLTASFTLSVYKKILYNKLGLSKSAGGDAISEIDIEAGTECTIYPIELEPGDNTPNEPLIWTSSDTNIAIVDRGGKITALADATGSVVISASASRSDNTNATASIVVNTYVKATSISISDAQIPQGQSKVMNYTVAPSTASEEITWTPTDSSVATVEDNGDGTITVNALKTGNTTIEGRSKSGGATVSVQIVVVTPIHMESLDIAVKDANSYRKSFVDEENITVYEVIKGEEVVLMPSYTPDNANDGLKWWYDVDGEDVAEGVVDSGNYVVTAKAVGTQLFTLTNTNGLVAKCKVKVIIPASYVKICKDTSYTEMDKTTVNLNNSTKVNAYMGTGVTDTCTWEASNDNVELSATTTSNREAVFIKGVKAGTTTITVTSENGLVDTLEVVVAIPVTNIDFVEEGMSITTSGLKLLLDESTVIALEILPEDTTAEKFTWTSTSGNVVITPSEDGRTATIVGNTVGSDTIKVTPDVGTAATLSVKVMQPTESISFTCEHTTINKGSTVTAEAVIEPVNANDGITYTVDKEGIVSLQPSTDGKTLSITGTGVGDVVITATTGSGKTATISLTVVTIEASEFTITGLTSTGYTYTGQAIEPSSVVVKYGNTTLKKGTDYTLSYENNIDVTDSAKVIVTGIGKYSGTKDAVFVIKEKAASTLTVKFIDSNSTSLTKIYDGNVYEPEIVIVNNSIALKEGVDYEVEYPDNPVNVGKYSIVISYQGNYTGTKTVTYSIAAKPISDETITVSEISATGYTYTGEAIQPTISVKDGENILVMGSEADYIVSYSGNVNASTSSSKGKITIKGKGNYTGTKVVEFVINPASISLVTVGAIADKTYTGKEQKPSVKVTFNEKTLSTTNYTLSYKSNTNTGKATIVITGKGNFKGTKNVYFKILPKQVKDVKQTKATKSSVTLTWTKAEGSPSGYRIYQYNTSTKKYKYVGATTKNKYTVSKLSAGSDYSYAVCAYKMIDGKKYNGQYSSACPVKTAPGVPSIRKAKTVSSSTISITLKKVKGATSYHVFVSTNGKKYTLKTKTSATTISITGLKSKKKYYIKVKAVRNINGKEYKSAYSKVKSLKTK